MSPRALLIILLLSPALQAQETKLLLDFESPADLKLFEFKQKSAAPSSDHATHGKTALKIASNEYMVTFRPPRDWSGFDALELDIFVEGDQPISGSLLIGDQAWQKEGKGSYWNRHNGGFTLRPGTNTLSIPVNGLFRGEAGSRNNDLKFNIDPKQIVRLDLGFGRKDAPVVNLYLDNLRLTRESRPAGILAFDLGPTSQMVFPGFTAISPATVHGKDGNRAGLNTAQGEGVARDDTFPTRLFRDAISMEGPIFIIDVPEKSAAYHGWVVYDDLGYWGGEVAHYRKRSILANNRVVFSEDRGDAGPSDYLYRFESFEPRLGTDVWSTCVAPLFAPRTFTCKSENGQIRLRFTADAGLSCRVAAIVLYPDSIRDAAQPWIDSVLKRNREEFNSRAICLGPKEQDLAIPADARQKGYWLGYPSLEQDVAFTDAPVGKDESTPLSRAAAKGQRLSFTFAIRPLKDLGPVQLHATDLVNAQNSARINARQIDLRYVHHTLHRGFNDIAYTIGPESLRPVAASALKLEKDLTRQFWVTVAIPADASPGTYQSTLTLTAGDLKLELPLSLEVLNLTLHEPDFLMGFYGTSVPRSILNARGDDAWRDLFKTLREAGINSFTGGPAVRFSGLDPAGKPLLDFTAADRFMSLAREAGFNKPVLAYGGPGMVEGLHGSYVIGEQGRAWEKKTGKPIGDLIALVWAAVRDHAKDANWLPILYEFTDEPRVLAQSQSQLDLMKLYRAHAPWVNIGGSYSVHWDRNDPFEQSVQEIFKTLNWSAVNLHTQADLDMAKQFGKQLHIYNQGRTRYSFGAYQWAEMSKGIAGRMQWHLLALHGYQFFNLDGREPDTAMINWGKDAILPTLSLHRCREGADDFRFAQTLHNLATKKNDRASLDWLGQISQQIPLNQNKPPAGFMSDELFRNECITRIKSLLGG